MFLPIHFWSETYQSSRFPLEPMQATEGRSSVQGGTIAAEWERVWSSRTSREVHMP